MRTVGVKLVAEVSNYMAGMKKAGAATVSLKDELGKAAKAGKLDAVADQAAHFGLIGVAAFAGVVKSAADFDKQMSAVSAATHAGTKDIALLRAAALQAGKDTQYSATQAAQGVTELAKAGVTTTDILGGGLKGALSLAAAGQMSVGDAAEAAASAMTQFGLSGAQVPHIADLLAAAAGKAQGSVSDMGQALNQSGLVASQFGLSIEDTTGVLAEFAHAGLTGSDAGTSLKTMLLALANPTTQTQSLMSDLGISFYDATGKFIGFNGVATVLQTRLKGLTDAQRQQALGQIFGNDAIRSASVLYKDGAAGVDKWRGAVDEAGYASKTASALTNNLAGDIERLKGSVETLAITSGSGANNGLRVLTKSLNAVVNQFLSLPSAVGSGLTVIAGVAGVTALALAGFVKLRKGVQEAQDQLSGMGPAGEKAATGLGKVAGAAGKAATAFAIWQVAMAAASAIQNDTATNIDALTLGLQKFGQGADLSGESARVLGGNLANLKTGFKFLADTNNDRRAAVASIEETLEKVTPGLAGYAKSLTNTQAQVTATDQALAMLVKQGNADDAAQAFQRLTGALAVGGVSIDEVKKKFPEYEAAVEAAGTGTKKLSDSLNWVGPPSKIAKDKLDALSTAALGTSTATGSVTSALDVGAASQEKYKTVADAAAGASRGEAAAITALSAKLKASTDPAFALLDAQKDLSDAQKTYNDALKQHGPKSAEARDAMRKLALAAIGLEGAAGTASQTLDGKMPKALKDTLTAAGFTKTEINQLAGQFKDAKKAGEDFAKKYPAAVSVTGLPAVSAALKYLGQLQDALKAGKAPPGGWSASTGSVLKGLNDPKLKAAGGSIEGPGGPTDDLIPAMLSNGEHVWTAAEVQRVGGQGAMYRLRKLAAAGKLDQVDSTMGFAAGGAVYPFPVTVSKTRIPSKKEVMAAVTPSLGSGIGYKAMEAAVRSVFGSSVGVISDFRPGAITITGNRSYHSVGRAVDFSPSVALAKWINANYFGQTRELITPWQNLNIWNGRRHSFSPLVENEHRGSNAHDHWAMANGGVIAEPVFGVGASGDTYSFGEGWKPERVTPMSGGHGGSPTKLVTFAPVIHINGQHVNPQQIAARVNREIGALIDQYARGN